MNAAQIAQTCLGALFFKRYDQVKDTCLVNFRVPSNLVVVLSKDKYLTFTPPYEDLKFDCEGENSNLEVRLQNLQLISEVKFCKIIDQEWNTLNSYLQFGDRTVKSLVGNSKWISVTTNEIEDDEIESIWPELGSTQFREKIVKTKANVTKSAVIRERNEL